MPDIDLDTRYLIRKALCALQKKHPEAYADMEVTGPLMTAKKAADATAALARSRSETRRGWLAA